MHLCSATAMTKKQFIYRATLHLVAASSFASIETGYSRKYYLKANSSVELKVFSASWHNYVRIGSENFVAALASLIPAGSSSRSSAPSSLELSGSTR